MSDTNEVVVGSSAGVAGDPGTPAGRSGAAPPPPPLPQAWDEDDVCAFLRISRRSLLELLGEDPSFPRPRRLHARRGRRWHPGAVPAWLEGRPTEDPAASTPGRRAVRRRGTTAVIEAPEHPSRSN